jgi:hypothetical protein
MDTNPDPKNSRSLDPNVDLRTIPSGWDLSGFYSPSTWVNEPQNSRETQSTRAEAFSGKLNDKSENAV